MMSVDQTAKGYTPCGDITINITSVEETHFAMALFSTLSSRTQCKCIQCLHLVVDTAVTFSVQS